MGAYIAVASKQNAEGRSGCAHIAGNERLSKRDVDQGKKARIERGGNDWRRRLDLSNCSSGVRSIRTVGAYPSSCRFSQCCYSRFFSLSSSSERLMMTSIYRPPIMKSPKSL